MFRGFNKVDKHNVLKCKGQVRLPCIRQAPRGLQWSYFIPRYSDVRIFCIYTGWATKK